MLKELLAGAWEARTLIPRLVVEVDKIMDELAELRAEMRAELDALKAKPAEDLPVKGKK